MPPSPHNGASTRTRTPSVNSVLEQAVRSKDSWLFPQAPDARHGNTKPSTLGVDESRNLCFEILEYVGSFDDRLICPICKCHMVAPLVTPCHHAFCYSCLHRHLDLSKTCPMDRRNLRQRDVRPSTELSDLLDKLEVLCPYSGQGCESKFERAHLMQHIEICKFSLNKSNAHSGPDQEKAQRCRSG
ncbi:TRAF-type zinc finger [Colletotrichum truncatum]|uniref:TRAF-type zinc finger n=2 Tax=Colletotrichum truncatum TaxID=5467 RepID=A0ACC3YCL1_COLTU|nr:TRAF-type zinc finger [Colletotrichum truncatum]XP_036584560.1 TRAF-type zinc finger [Colletotrichum truncatum]KAF6794063.1 TRAF-type zinc finger [Colletotrichum truncatum]KAF6794078.1 TRAF-type zinc finger [Colletotrichum truncatum]